MNTSKPLDTSELAERIKSKDQSAFTVLYDNYSAALFGIIKKKVKDTGTAEEILQDVFLKIWMYAGDYDSSKAGLFTWMYNIAKNCCIDYLRSKRHRKMNFTTQLNPELVLAGINVNYKMSTDELRGIIYQLGPQYGSLIDKIYYWGYTQREISQITNLPLGTVKTRCRLGIQRMRDVTR